MVSSSADLRGVFDRVPVRHDRPEAGLAATAAVFTPELDLLFIRRATHPQDPWSGHVSFPGGRVETVDSTPLHAAIRETCEEIGVDLRGAEVLGELDELTTVSPLPPVLVRPFVFALDHEPAPVLDATEVNSLHRISLEALLRGDGRGEMTLHWRGDDHVLPRVDFDGVRLWGLTLRAVDDLLHRLDGRGTGLQRPRFPGMT